MLRQGVVYILVISTGHCFGAMVTHIQLLCVRHTTCPCFCPGPAVYRVREVGVWVSI